MATIRAGERMRAEAEGRLVTITVAELGFPEGGDHFDIDDAAQAQGFEGLTVDHIRAAEYAGSFFYPATMVLQLIRPVDKSADPK